ncbi:dimeric dUTPase (all-alpha-NTP-PPase superfamily) [Evansella vedderi]|uniref:Dimeric dUTPase (All-alpha-NTP-PPase superfamily) n=2 Tax=Evansella vedderi TaxID=38282 RepID=A0ABU0A4Y0_9BACI|nr:dimeric dUTPase (all-alpha-NTP-PPase superfamily) [Evansella vedderi]
MQKELDSYIERKHRLENAALLDRKLLAFHVELGELANETRCFKFWSEKGPSADHIVLEEYVDGIHFILSVGLELKYDNITTFSFPVMNPMNGEALVPYFYGVIESVYELRQNINQENYENLFRQYLKLGSALGFSEEDIISAYKRKNEVNHERQNQGY